MRFFLVIIFTIILSSATVLTGCTPQNVTFPSQFTVVFTTENVKNSCLGVKINDCFVLTVAHIFDVTYERKNICTLSDKSGNLYEAEVTYADFSADLALVHMTDSDYDKKTPLVFGKSDTNFFCDSTGEMKISKNTETVNCLSENKPDRLLRLNFTASKGESGSAVVSPDGKITGIICAADKFDEICYAVPSEIIVGFLSRCGIRVLLL